MSTNERDTQFQDAARLFVDDLQTKDFISRAEFETYVAQFVYDVVKHVMYYAPITEYEYGIDDIPDMTAQPKPD